MRKGKKEKITPESETGVKLEKATYWKWRLSIEEVDHARTKVDLAGASHKIKLLEASQAQLAAKLLTEKIKSASIHLDKLKKAYSDEKSQIEKTLGMSLNDCSIDEYTYEVRALPKPKGA